MFIENMNVFKTTHELTLNLYRTTKQFPTEEKFGLTSQIRRASSSICANLMEGNHRNSQKEFRHFAGISRGSVGELKYHLMLARDLEYISKDDYRHYSGSLENISKMLYGLIDHLEH